MFLWFNETYCGIYAFWRAALTRRVNRLPASRPFHRITCMKSFDGFYPGKSVGTDVALRTLGPLLRFANQLCFLQENGYFRFWSHTGTQKGII